MKEILFRGKRADNGEWVYGYVVKIKTDKTNEGWAIKDTLYHINDGCCDLIPEEVIPETIGQFTGLTDKSGKEIFEGDMVVWGGDRDAFFEVFWHDYECRYSLRVHWQGNRCGGYVPLFDANHSFEIIGNIHDNPEIRI